MRYTGGTHNDGTRLHRHAELAITGLWPELVQKSRGKHTDGGGEPRKRSSVPNPHIFRQHGTVLAKQILHRHPLPTGMEYTCAQ